MHYEVLQQGRRLNPTWRDTADPFFRYQLLLRQIHEDEQLCAAYQRANDGWLVVQFSASEFAKLEEELDHGTFSAREYYALPHSFKETCDSTSQNLSL